MARYKPSGKKIRLIARAKQNRPVPLWVIVKTKRRFRFNPHRYNWRRSRLQR